MENPTTNAAAADVVSKKSHKHGNKRKLQNGKNSAIK